MTFLSTMARRSPRLFAAARSSRPTYASFSSITYPDYENIVVQPQIAKGVALITLNRPKTLNALCDALFQDLLEATHTLQHADDAVRCVVLTGSSKAFAAGADISEMASRNFADVYKQDMFAEWQELSSSGPKPIVAAVQGYCLGGGCELAMLCDILIASSTATFGQPEIHLGVIPGAGGTQRLTRAVGKSKSMLWNLTGDFISAQEAYDSGLVAKVVDVDDIIDDKEAQHDRLIQEAVSIAAKIARKGGLAVQACKEAVNASQELSLTEGLRLERRLFHAMFATHDQKEGMQAFLEKREPEFKNE